MVTVCVHLQNGWRLDPRAWPCDSKIRRKFLQLDFLCARLQHAMTNDTPLRQTFRTPLTRQIESALAQRAALMADPLLDLSTVRVALGGIGYSKMGQLLKSGELPSVRIGKRGHRKVRTSALKAFLAEAVTRG